MRDLVVRLDREAGKLIASLEAHPVARRLFEGTITARQYAAYLEQTQHYVGVAQALLRASGERLEATGRLPRLARLLLEKSEEESGHDAWAEADRAALGLATEKQGPNLAVQAYIFGHRFEAEEGCPAAFLGTAYVLEALSARRAGSAARNLVVRSGIAGIEKAVSFLRSHGDADEGHIERLAELLRDAIDPADGGAILRSARRTRLFFPGFFSSRR